MVLVCLAALPLSGCSSSAESTDMDRAAIEAALQRYAEALEWPRGTGWEEGFLPIAPHYLAGGAMAGWLRALPLALQ